MAGPGLLYAAYTSENGYEVYPAGAPQIAEHDLGENPGFNIGDWSNYLWYTFTPTHSGVVSIDLYLTTAAGSEDQAGVEAYSDTIYKNAPGWQYIAQEYGGPDEDLARYIGTVTAGVPVIFNVYGYQWDSTTRTNAPVDLRVRVSDVVDPGDAPWVDSMPTRRIFQANNDYGQGRLGYQDSDAAPVVIMDGSGSNVYGFKSVSWSGAVSAPSNGGTTWDIGTIQQAHQLSRKGQVDTLPVPPFTQEVREDQASDFFNFNVGVSASARIYHDETGAITEYNSMTVQSDYYGLQVDPDIAYYGVNNFYNELAWPPPPDDDEHVMQLAGAASGVVVTDLAFAPDAGSNAGATTNADTLSHVGPMKVAILPTTPKEAGRWGPSDTSAVVVNTSGPETVVTLPEAQVLSWDPVAPSTFTPLEPGLLEHFTSAEGLFAGGTFPLVAVVYVEGQTSDISPFTDPTFVVVPSDPSQINYRLTQGGNYGFCTMHTKATFVRRWRQVAKPELWTEPLVEPSITGSLKETRQFFSRNA